MKSMRGIRIGALIDAAAGVAMIAASAVVLWAYVRTKPSPTVPKLEGKLVSFAGTPTKGSSAAGVAIIVFSDFECPFCRKFAQETLPEINRIYLDTGKVLMAFRQLPLETVHRNALVAAEGAECAAEEEGFWPMHDRLFAAESLSVATVNEVAASLGLSNKWKACFDSGGRGSVKRDQAEANMLEITGTPTFIVGRIVGHQQVRQR
jgi:protein-disulfide isomerase